MHPWRYVRGVRPVSYTHLCVLYESGVALNHVYFPTTAIVSLLYVMEDGASAEIAVVGNEGVVGVSIFMGGETTPSRAVVQSAGKGYRLRAGVLKEEFNRSAPALHLLLRYTQALITQMAQTAEMCIRDRAMSAEFATPIAPGFEALVFKARHGIEDIYELTYRRKDGSRLPAVVSVTALRDASESIIGYLLIGTDNTARKQSEAEKERLDQHLQSALQQTHRAMRDAKVAAETANRAKSEFLSNMSHELRSPLNAILGFAQLMDTGVPPPTTDQKDSIDQIMQAGWYLLELINEILDLALIESGKISMSPEPMSLAEVLADCLAMIEPQALSLIHI